MDPFFVIDASRQIDDVEVSVGQCAARRSDGVAHARATRKGDKAWSGDGSSDLHHHAIDGRRWISTFDLDPRGACLTGHEEDQPAGGDHGERDIEEESESGAAHEGLGAAGRRSAG
jgi:hypothetical protein